jgi:hypothetical protein
MLLLCNDPYYGGDGPMRALNKIQKALGGGESLRPLDYMILTVITMIALLHLWVRF